MTSTDAEGDVVMPFCKWTGDQCVNDKENMKFRPTPPPTALPGRRNDRRPEDQEYYDDCYFWLNIARAKEALPPLRPWFEEETCADRQAQDDMENGEIHDAFKNGKYCHGSLQPMAQNGCPNWPSELSSVKKCILIMWQEKYDFDMEKRTNDKGEVEVVCAADEAYFKKQAELGLPAVTQCGHYDNIRGRKGVYGYNFYNKVGCGIFRGRRGMYVLHNFGRDNRGFPCGNIQVFPKLPGTTDP